jgi:hypothetical protein
VLAVDDSVESDVCDVERDGDNQCGWARAVKGFIEALNKP